MYIYRHSRYIQRLDECMSSLIMMENLLPCPSVTIFFIYPSNSKKFVVIQYLAFITLIRARLKIPAYINF